MHKGSLKTAAAAAVVRAAADAFRLPSGSERVGSKCPPILAGEGITPQMTRRFL